MSILRLRILNTAAFCGLLTLGLSHPAVAKTLCVNPGATGGCLATIGAAVSAAAAGDTINIGPGEYAESVVITKSLQLVGSGAGSSIINAKGLANGIYVDGLDNGGLSNVLITDLTVMNANFEGILLTNTSYSFITKNHVTNNDQSLNYSAGSCPGQPVFETNEGDDCGEGIHLIGVDHTTVANNESDLNSGGLLISDETGPSYENDINSNSVHDNALDCGITLASHAPSPQASSKLPYGVFNNTIVGNNASSNGLIGAGAGIGIFAPGPGNLNFGNKVIGNVAMNNGLPGITVHNHAAPPGAPGINLNDTVIIGNFLSGNGADTQDATTPGTAGINIYSVSAVYATEVVGNTIQNEAIGIVMNNPGEMDVRLNNLPASGIGVDNLGTGALHATMNYFGCAGGPGATGCSTVKGSVGSSPWLTAPNASAPSAPKRPAQ
ncbi:MAG: right-handed parallel beta-helix repeat-containing protein [Bryobacteraceae bacterium]